jgi:hypothetical protein
MGDFQMIRVRLVDPQLSVTGETPWVVDVTFEDWNVMGPLTEAIQGDCASDTNIRALQDFVDDDFIGAFGRDEGETLEIWVDGAPVADPFALVRSL